MFSKKISNKDLLVLFNCLERYSNTGFNAKNAIIEFSNINNNLYLNEVLEEICADLTNGSYLSASLAKHPEVFPSYIVELIKVGERTGDLGSIYLEIINYLDEQIKIESSMTSALLMPKVFGVLILFMMAGYIFFVLPRITKQLSQMNTDVPFITSMLISFGNFCVDFWFIWLFVVVAAYFGFGMLKKSYPLYFDYAKYKMPIVGELYNLQLNYQFNKLLAICRGAGIELKSSLSITSSAIPSPCMKQCLEDVVSNISRPDFIELLRESDKYSLLNPFIYPLLNAGIVSNTLDIVLNNEAERCIRQINYCIKKVEEKVGNLVLVPIWGILIIVMLAIVMPFISMIESTGAKVMGGGL